MQARGPEVSVLSSPRAWPARYSKAATTRGSKFLHNFAISQVK